MKRLPVNSSNIKSVGYNNEASVLEIEFNNSGIYFYKNVPEKTFVDFLNASSKGMYFNENIKTKYSFAKGEFTPPTPTPEVIKEPLAVLPPPTLQDVQKKEETRGRKEIITESTVQQLVALFQRGHSDTYACQAVRIGRTTFYNKMKNDEEFRNKIVDAKNFGTAHATDHIIDLLMDHDYEGIKDKTLKVETAKWWLERKDPEGYGKPTMNIGVQNNQQNNYYYGSADELEADMRKQLKEREEKQQSPTS